MRSSSDETIRTLQKWVETKAKIVARSTSDGLVMQSPAGRLEFADKHRYVLLRDESGLVVLSLDLLRATPKEKFEPLLDAPEDARLKLDFFVAVGFRLADGWLDFFEIADEGFDTEAAPR